MKKEVEVRNKIIEAFEKGSYLITVSVYNEKTNELTHYYSWKDFPRKDLLPSLDHVKAQIAQNDFNRKERRKTT